MAIYPYKCSCGKAEEVVQSISSYSVSPRIPQCCGAPMNRIFTVPMVSPDLSASFVSPIDGTVISSRAEQREHMARHGVVLYDDIKEDFPKKRQEAIKAAQADIKEDIAEALTKLDQGYRPPPLKAAQGSVEAPDVVSDLVSTESA